MNTYRLITRLYPGMIPVYELEQKKGRAWSFQFSTQDKPFMDKYLSGNKIEIQKSITIQEAL